LKQEIKKLTPSEFAALRKWFREYDAANWDREIEKDALAGKFDTLVGKALADHEAGRTTEI